MVFIILESLIIKGGMTIAHWIAAHGTGAAVAKTAGTVVTKSIATQGLASTASAVTATAVGSSLVVGGVMWTTDLVNLFFSGLDDLKNGNYMGFCLKMAKVAKKSHVDIEFLPDKVSEFMETVGYSKEDASKVSGYIADSEYEIWKFMTNS